MESIPILLEAQEILQSLDKVLLGSVTVIFLLLISLLQYIFSSTYKVPFYVLIIVMLVCYAVCIIIYAVMHSQKERERTSEYPRVITVTGREQKEVNWHDCLIEVDVL